MIGGEKLFQVLGVLGTLFGIYKVLASDIPMIDTLLIFLVGFTLIAVARDVKKFNNKMNMEIMIPIKELQNGISIRKESSALH